MEKFKHCLLIDDDVDDQDIFKMCVSEIGAKITCSTSNSGVEAIAMLQSEVDYRPDFMFIDMNMPRINGIECLRKIREMKRADSARIFMYSTTSEPRAVKESRELGAEEFIVKPVRVSELMEKLSQIFGRE